jgi:hypothetical protein
LAHGDAAFDEEAADLIDNSSALADKAGAHAMLRALDLLEQAIAHRTFAQCDGFSVPKMGLALPSVQLLACPSQYFMPISRYIVVARFRCSRACA